MARSRGESWLAFDRDVSNEDEADPRGHPVAEETIQEAMVEVCDRSNMVSVEEVDESLHDLQADAERVYADFLHQMNKNKWKYPEESWYANHGSFLLFDCFHSDPKLWFKSLKGENGREETHPLHTNDPLGEIAIVAHLTEAQRQVEKNSLVGAGTNHELDLQRGALVMTKPHHYGYAEGTAMIPALNHLGAAGLSASEMLDYFVVSTHHRPTHLWAAARGVSTEAVNQNVRHAREKLNQVYGEAGDFNNLRDISPDRYGR